MNSFFYHQKRQFKKKKRNTLFSSKKILRSDIFQLQNQQPSSWRLRNNCLIQNVHILVIKFMNYKHVHICKRIACSRSLSMLGAFCYFLAW